MKAEVRFSPEALEDLDRLHAYIAPRGGEAVAEIMRQGSMTIASALRPSSNAAHCGRMCGRD
jgi:plasmid stabilization system protein ParE